MNYTEAIVSGLLLGCFLAISVGPLLFAIIQYSLQHSYKAGIAFILGVSISDMLFVSLANLATNWLTFLEDHHREVGYIGGGIFVIMGLYTFFKKYKPKRPKKAAEISISRGLYFKIWLSGFLMNTFNPAVVLIWVFAAAKVKTDPMAIRFVFFTTCLGVIIGSDLLKVLLSDKIRKWLTIRKVMYLNKISALLIFVFGLMLLAKVYFNVDLGH